MGRSDEAASIGEVLLFVTAEYEGLLRLMLAALASGASFRDERELVMAEAAFRVLSSVFKDSTVLIEESVPVFPFLFESSRSREMAPHLPR